MNLLRVIKMCLLAVAVALTGCEKGIVPEELRAPSLPSVSAVADRCAVTLTAIFKNDEDLASAREFGFYFGEDEHSMERLTVTRTDGLEYSLIKENLEYSTTYLYKAWVGNGRDEMTSDLREVVTDEEPVGPDPPSPVERNIEFKDPAVKAICVKNWDLDGDGELSKAEAAKVTSLRHVFKRNEEITSFEELEYFTNLRSVTDSAFKCCVNLRSVKLPESVREIGDHVFEECGEVILPKLPDNLASIGESAFCFCAKLSLMSLPETLTSIGNWAFSCCKNVLIPKLPDNLEIIGTHAFRRCSRLSLRSLPESLKSIAGFAFSECTSLNLTNLPSGLTRIEDGVFAWCSHISPEELPSGLTFIGSWAFDHCYSFNTELLRLPAGVKYIGLGAFNFCQFWEVIIPEEVEYIGPYAFSSCTLLRKVTVLPAKPPRMEDTYLGDNASVIFVPSASIEEYRAAKNWSEWKTK